MNNSDENSERIFKLVNSLQSNNKKRKENIESNIESINDTLSQARKRTGQINNSSISSESGAFQSKVDQQDNSGSTSSEQFAMQRRSHKHPFQKGLSVQDGTYTISDGSGASQRPKVIVSESGNGGLGTIFYITLAVLCIVFFIVMFMSVKSNSDEIKKNRETIGNIVEQIEESKEDQKQETQPEKKSYIEEYILVGALVSIIIYFYFFRGSGTVVASKKAKKSKK